LGSIVAERPEPVQRVEWVALGFFLVIGFVLAVGFLRFAFFLGRGFQLLVFTLF
jgi:hypothetical protein